MTSVPRLIRRIYDWLPLSPALRHQFGRWVRRWRRRPGRSAALESTDAGPLRQGPAISLLPGASVGEGDSDSFAGWDFVFFGVIDWHFRHQRPQQLALALARRGARVFYVSVNFINDRRPGFQWERLDPDLPLCQVFFQLPGEHSVYGSPPSEETLDHLRCGQARLWQDANIRRAVHVVQHPYWARLAGYVPQALLVYDCMDFHAGFSNTGRDHESVERQLVRMSDLTVVTSDYLQRHVAGCEARQISVIRNAAEFDLFHSAVRLDREASPSVSVPSRRVLGYYGAIADWFDVVLVDRLAKEFADVDIVLIGEDSADAGRQLAQHRHVRFAGERPYAELPLWLAGFDVCLIPFRVSELTLATNPVKAYEYLSAGKPVVGSDLPELAQFGDLVYRAADTAEFLVHVQTALDEAHREGAADLRARRSAFASQQTWQSRADAFLAVLSAGLREPLVSVVVVAFHQWHLTERCLNSLEAAADGAPIEVIVVDNASADDTPQHLQRWEAQQPSARKAVLNECNRGFGPAVNQGLALARGDYLVVLNNDTVVSPGWARGLRRHFESDPDLGLICPITNNIGNEAQVALPGSSPEEVFESARAYCLDRSGKSLPLSIAAFFCVMMPRRVYERIGPLDEQFVPGFFEDDDYCLRVRQAGWRIACAEDVFVYHELSASFDAEGAARRQAIFQRNRALFEAKWGPWTPHVYREESLPRP